MAGMGMRRNQQKLTKLNLIHFAFMADIYVKIVTLVSLLAAQTSIIANSIANRNIIDINVK